MLEVLVEKSLREMEEWIASRTNKDSAEYYMNAKHLVLDRKTPRDFINMFDDKSAGIMECWGQLRRVFQ
jgi:hypothetical protein